jgi:protein disulfide-isomerase
LPILIKWRLARGTGRAAGLHYRGDVVTQSNRLARISAVVAGLGLALAATAAVLPYDEQADPDAQLHSALRDARRAHKRVLIVFGANWCEDCRALDHAFHDGATGRLIRARYVVLKVDVGHFDKNLDFAALYGKPIEKGIPSVVVVTPKNEVVYRTRAGELADARSMGSDGIRDFFRDIAARPPAD